MKKHITQVKERNISFIPSQEQSYKRAMQNIWSSNNEENREQSQKVNVRKIMVVDILYKPFKCIW